MASVSKEINEIRTAQYGVDVRESLAKGLELVNKETEQTTELQNTLNQIFKQLIIDAGNSNSEIVASRGETDWLPDRLTNINEQINNASSSLESVSTDTTIILGVGVYGEKYPKLPEDGDDFPRMARAIAALTDVGKGKLVLTQQDYYTSQNLFVPENVELEGKGHGKDITCIHYTGEGFAIRSTGHHTRSNIKNIRLETNGNNSGIQCGDFFANLNGYVPGLTRFENVTVTGVGQGQMGLYLLNTSHVTLDNVHIGYDSEGGIGCKIESDQLNTGVIVANNCTFGRVDNTNHGLVIDGNAALDSFVFNACYFGGKSSPVQLGKSPAGVVRAATFNSCHFECRDGEALEIYNVRGGGIFGGSIQGYWTLKYGVVFKAEGIARRFNVFGVESNGVLVAMYRNEGALTLEDCILQASARTGSSAWYPESPYVIGQKVYNGENVYECVIAGESGTLPPTHKSGTSTDGEVVWKYFAPILQQFIGDFNNCQRFDETKLRLKTIVPEEIFLGGRKIDYGNNAPTSGTFAQGDKRINTSPTKAKNIHYWQCVLSGTPGLWMAVGTGHGTTSERPSLLVNDGGYLYRNTETGNLEYWSGSVWI